MARPRGPLELSGARAGLRLALTAMAFAALPAHLAFADEAADTSAARTFGTEGVILADAGKCEEAIEKLEKAEKLHHAPTTAERLGECDIDVGHVVAGSEILQRLVREPLGPTSPPAFAAAQARAQKVLPQALPKIATVHVSVTAPPGAKPVLVIDGETLSDAFIDADRPVDPGVHSIQVTARGYLASGARVTLREGESQRLTFKLEVDPNAAANDAAAAVRNSDTGAVSSPTSGGTSRAPAITAFVIGGAGLIVGGVAGGLALGKMSTVDKECPGKVCPATSNGASDLSSVKTLGTVSTVGFVAAGVGAVVGVVLLVSSGPASSRVGSTEVLSRHAEAHALAVRPVIGDRYFGLDGTF